MTISVDLEEAKSQLLRYFGINDAGTWEAMFLGENNLGVFYCFLLSLVDEHIPEDSLPQMDLLVLNACRRVAVAIGLDEESLEKHRETQKEEVVEAFVQDSEQSCRYNILLCAEKTPATEPDRRYMLTIESNKTDTYSSSWIETLAAFKSRLGVPTNFDDLPEWVKAHTFEKIKELLVRLGT